MESLRMQPTLTPAPSSSVLKPSEATEVRAQVQTRSESSTHQSLTTEARVALTDQLWKLLWEVNDEHNDKRIKSQEYLGEVRSVLHHGADPNATDEAHHPKRNWTPLHEVCFSGNAPELIEILLEFCANPNAIDNKRRTALHMCSVSDQVANSERIAKALIIAGANLNAKDRYGSTPLHTMTYIDGSLNLLTVLINSGADVNASDDEGRVPLVRPIAYGQRRLLDFLVERGANVHARDKYGRSVLEVARQDLESGMAGDGSGFLKPEILDYLKQFGLLPFRG